MKVNETLSISELEDFFDDKIDSDKNSKVIHQCLWLMNHPDCSVDGKFRTLDIYRLLITRQGN